MRGLVVGVGMLLAANLALADNDSLVTLGVGTHAALMRPTRPDAGTPAMAMHGAGVTVRLRLLYVLGVEATTDVAKPGGGAALKMDAPTYNWSALLYLLPFSRFSLFVLGGLGATNPRDLGNMDGGTTSVHGGGGIEIGFTPNFILAADMRLNVPSFSRVENGSNTPGLTMTSAINAYNVGFWQGNVGLRYYL